MPKSFQPAPGDPDSTDQGQRLESWKEIAAYLKRDVRTVQRWEKREGLPVHRHAHEKLSSVYTYTSELDSWRSKGRVPIPEPVEHTQSDSSERHQSWNWRLWVSATALSLLGVVVVAGLMWLSKPEPDTTFHKGDWILISRFENRTEQAQLDGILEVALARYLSDSPFANIVPPERIADALKLMKREPDTPIDSRLGLEVALRDGGIREVLAGRIERVGAGFEITADLIDVKSGKLSSRFVEHATSPEAFSTAAHRLSDQVRQSLGESQTEIADDEQRLEKVTTPSSRALRLYSQGMALMNEEDWEPAGELFEQAVGEDPQFASAHVYLAHCYANMGRVKEAGTHFQRAFALKEGATDRERYFIQASYYDGFLGDRDKAIEAYRTLVALYPNDYWGNNNLANDLGGPHSSQAVPYVVQRAEIRPSDIDAAFDAARGLAVAGNMPAAERFVLHLKVLLSSPEVAQEHSDIVVWTELFPGWEAWLKGDPNLLLQELDRLKETVNSRTGVDHDRFAIYLSSGYMTLGRLKTASELIESVEEPKTRYIDRAFLSFLRNDRRELQLELRHGQPSPEYFFAIALLARSGLVDDAEKALSSIAPNEAPADYFTTLRGQIALARGQVAEAIPLLQRSLSWKEESAGFLLGSEDLAHAWELQGDLPRAIRILEEQPQQEVVAGCCAFVWVHMQGQLAELYRRASRDQDAERTEARLFRLLADADEDDPILLRLKGSRSLASVQAPK